MFSIISMTALAIVIILPLVLQFGFKLSGKTMKKVLGVNLFAFFGMLAVATIALFAGAPVAVAEAAEAAGATSSTGFGYLAAALSTGLCGIGAGIGVASPASAAIGAVSEDPKIMGKSLIFVALAEGIALYGMLISFMILSRI